jgi:hypothetical protein
VLCLKVSYLLGEGSFGLVRLRLLCHVERFCLAKITEFTLQFKVSVFVVYFRAFVDFPQSSKLLVSSLSRLATLAL